MSFIRIVQTLGLLECCDGRKGKSFADQKRRVPDEGIPSACINCSSEEMVCGVGINFRADKSGALVVLSLMPQGNDHDFSIDATNLV